jgi:hypothetical protein
MALSEPDVGILTLERHWWARAGNKEQAIGTLLEMTPMACWRRVNRLLEDPAALAHDPMLVHRLRRLRDVRRESRGARSRRAG